MRRFRRWAGSAALVVVLTATAAGCGEVPRAAPVIRTDQASAPLDESAHLRITGLSPNERISVAAEAVDAENVTWQSGAEYRADRSGTVALDTARPLNGSYQRPDGMGLFWSMVPSSGDSGQAVFVPRPRADRGYDVWLAVAASGRRTAVRTLTRVGQGPGVTRQVLQPRLGGVAGELYLPAPGTPRHPPVLLIGGTTEDEALGPTAALLATRGYPALSVAYPGQAGLPGTLTDVPLEYFRAAAQLLAGQPGTDPAHLAVLGYARGSEAALQLAQDYPDLVHGAVLYAPADRVGVAFHGPGAAWTLAGRPVPSGPIPVDRVNGPVLTLAGGQDPLWPAASAAQAVTAALDAAGHAYPHKTLVYPQAGHQVGTFPYQPGGIRLTDPLTGVVTDLGGSPAANAGARADGWPQVLSLLGSLSG
ncbi:acyl-CoA thioesterase/BAAT N-terminal domain-containing protein [Kitasatospora sp. NPDC052896]|uniref:acyl-CoA thioesterase/BAAT N-terminal domain-containing protein n=1 Tax=Kitasatospora sp. NPDC052896 TaxID=3364061 RepID=UPI0037CA8B4C